jgi:YggT family protein
MPSTLIGLISFLVELFLNMATVIIISSVIISWMGADVTNPIVRFIQNVSEPLCRPFRRMTKGIDGPIDLPSLIVLLIISGIQNGLLPYVKILILNPT